MFACATALDMSTHSVQPYRAEWYHTNESVSYTIATLIEQALYNHESSDNPVADRMALSTSIVEKIVTLQRSTCMSMEDQEMINDILFAIMNAPASPNNTTVSTYAVFRAAMFELKEYLKHKHLVGS